jgi:DNA-binding XRE family transcriptional regulator
MYRKTELLSIKINKKEGMLNKFAEWMMINDKKQRGVALKLGISTSTLHAILRQGQLPSLITAYEIERYTRGIVTVYDWIDIGKEAKTPTKTKTKIKKTKK